VTHLFACPEQPPPSATHPTAPAPRLDLFIAYALHRTRLHESVTYAALYLLQRLKGRFPAARGSSGHRLFISAFMLSSKVICDDTYSNKSWSIVGQGMFALREINQMEREMCSYLEWQLNVEPSLLQDFTARVKRDFKGPGPYPTFCLPSPAPSPMPSTTPYMGPTPNPPSFVTGRPPSSSPPKAVPRRPPPTDTGVPHAPQPEPRDLDSAPNTPDTPEASHSNSTSPASSVSPPTPAGMEDLSAKIVSPSGSVPMDSAAGYKPGMSRTQPSRRPSQGRPLQKGDLFAFAMPIEW
jgi:hypothetical protein